MQVGNVLISSDLITERFCCDLEACKGACCIEGDAGAPVTLDEIAAMEDAIDIVWNELSAQAQTVIDLQGVACTDREGDLVTSIVNGKDCVFTCHENGCCFCTTDRAFRQGRTQWSKPISCYLYPIREKYLGANTIGLNYHRWNVCEPARRKGRELRLRVYEFLKEPLILRFGKEWYEELLQTVTELKKHRMI